MTLYFEPKTETWSWGDLFEVEVPIDCAIRELGEAVEIAARTIDGRVHLAAFDADEGAEDAAAPVAAAQRVLERFGAARGAEEGLDIALTSDPDGLVRARCGLDDATGHWTASAVAWPGHVVLCTAWSTERDGGIFALAEHLVTSLKRPPAPTPLALAPDAPGEF